VVVVVLKAVTVVVQEPPVVVVAVAQVQELRQELLVLQTRAAGAAVEDIQTPAQDKSAAQVAQAS
jgi:hypothetical protein